MKKFSIALLIMLLITACGNSVFAGESINYGDEKAFEDALNNGEFLEGKIVRFTVTDICPDSAFGFNLISGEHLNFVSSRNPNVQIGDELVVRTDSISSMLGSWIVTYEIIEDAVESSDTIYGKDAEPTPTPLLITPVVTADGATAENAVPIWIPSIESVSLTGEYAYPAPHDDTFSYVLFFRNDSDEDVSFDVKATARDGAGNILGVSADTTVTVCAGYEAPAICRFVNLDYYDVIGINYEMNKLDSRAAYRPKQNVISFQQSDMGDKILITITNNDTEKVDFVMGHVFFFRDNKMINNISMNLPGDSSLEPGIPRTIEIPNAGLQYDFVKVFVDAYNR